ncbi:MAG: cell division ATP-binding protein FtsE [Nitrospinae bacterium]|nr:cell division ATP-binding protein FtsE [Nitrospinota bacterium]
MIQMYHVYKIYDGDFQALRDITIHIEKGEFVFITGPSGAGKTTLLRLIFCGEKVDRGQILVKGKNLIKIKGSEIAYLRRHIGIVFQDFKLLPQKTVFENILFAQEVIGLNGRNINIKRRAWEVLSYVGLSHKKDSFPLRLSGGEQQRIAIARALVNNPIILLADEPTGNLDTDMAMGIIGLFEDANAKGATVVLATHNREIINRSRHREIRLNRGKMINS